MLIDYRSSGVTTTRIKHLLAFAVGEASDEKLSHILQNMYSNSAAGLYVWLEDGEASGVIGVRVQGDSLEILHIAVDKRVRNRGVGRRLIDAVVALEHPRELVAETDQDAVAFYRKCGFSIRSLGETYPGVERFLCRRRHRQ